MFVKNIHVDRFGACANRHLNGLTEGLNVIYGPIGSGKSTIVSFIRAIFFGFDANSTSPFVPHNCRGFHGSLTLVQHNQTRKVTRTDDGTLSGKITVEDPAGQILSDQSLHVEMPDLSAELYDRVYSIDFERRPYIDHLLDEIRRQGILGTGHPRADELAKLRAMQAEFERELATLPVCTDSLTTLNVRRSELLEEIQRLVNETTDHHQLRRQELRDKLTAVQGQLETARNQLQRLEAEIATLREALRDALHREAMRSNDELSRKQHQLAELERQISSWRQMLSEISGSKGALTPGPLDYPIDAHAQVNANPRSALKTIESKLQGMQKSLQNWNTTTNHQVPLEQLRLEMISGLGDIRQEVYRLCHDLTQWQQSFEQTRDAHDWKQVGRCEHEFQRAIDSLMVRRKKLVSEIQAIDPTFCHHDAEAWCECDSHPKKEKETLALESEELEKRLLEAERAHERTLDLVNELEAEVDDLVDRLEQLKWIEKPHLIEHLEKCRKELHRVEDSIRILERRIELTNQLDEIRQEIQAILAEGVTSSYLRDASTCVQRLSGSDLQSIEVGQNHDVAVVTETGQKIHWQHLDQGGRDQVYLALALTAIEALSQRGIRMPVVFRAAFNHFSSKNTHDAAEVIRDFAARGHQVVFLSRHEHVSSVFRMLNCPVFELEPLPTVATAQEPVAPAAANWDEKHNDVHAEPEVEVAYLHEDSPIEDAPSIDTANAVRLRKIGIITVGHLLRVNLEAAAAELAYAGITAIMLDSWRAQSLLVCKVPGLRAYDARILVACGIRDHQKLVRMSKAELRTIVERFAASSNGQAVLMSGTEFELSRVSDWLKTSDRFSNLAQPSSNGNGSHPNGSYNHGVGANGNGANGNGANGNGSNGNGSGRRRGNRSEQERAPRDVIKLNGDSEWVFYLSADDPVVDAPSIGPKTAERLEATGIRTVRDLLDCDPAQVAETMQQKRVTTKTIQQWQQQTELASRVPELRGHDAQVLVAVGVTTPEMLAASSPTELWAKVEPFVASNAGKRIIRNGHMPDLDEVTAWIEWATAARTEIAA